MARSYHPQIFSTPNSTTAPYCLKRSMCTPNFNGFINKIPSTLFSVNFFQISGSHTHLSTGQDFSTARYFEIPISKRTHFTLPSPKWVPFTLPYHNVFIEKFDFNLHSCPVKKKKKNWYPLNFDPERRTRFGQLDSVDYCHLRNHASNAKNPFKFFDKTVFDGCFSFLCNSKSLFGIPTDGRVWSRGNFAAVFRERQRPRTVATRALGQSKSNCQESGQAIQLTGVNFNSLIIIILLLLLVRASLSRTGRREISRKRWFLLLTDRVIGEIVVLGHAVAAHLTPA